MKIFNRKDYLQKGNDVPSLPVLAVRGHLCYRCFQPAPNMFKFTGCVRAAYCSKLCQKKDWTECDKSMCKRLKKINVIEKEEAAMITSNSFERYKMALVRHFMAFLPSCF